MPWKLRHQIGNDVLYFLVYWSIYSRQWKTYTWYLHFIISTQYQCSVSKCHISSQYQISYHQGLCYSSPFVLYQVSRCTIISITLYCNKYQFTALCFSIKFHNVASYKCRLGYNLVLKLDAGITMFFKCEKNINIKVKVCVYSPDISSRHSGLHYFPPKYWNSLFITSINWYY